MFVIEDEMHAERQGEFATLAEAQAEIKVLAQIAWDSAPNRAPCTNWKKCGREYEIIEFDASSVPWIEIRRISVLRVSALGTVWHRESNWPE